MIQYTTEQEKNLRYNLEDTLLFYIDAKQLDPVIDSILQLFSTVLGQQKPEENHEECSECDIAYEDGYADGLADGRREGYQEAKDEEDE